MGTSENLWCWYYLADCGRWHKFEDDPNNPLQSQVIEKCYLRNSKAALTMSYPNYHSNIDFSEMLQTDLTTGKQRRIQRSYNIERSCSCFSAAPVFWEKVDPKHPYQLIPLSELTPEYKTVARYVKEDGLLDRPIVSVYRIQNLDLWEMFCRKKKQLMRIQGVTEIQERRLFHGTDIRNVDSICKYNFDLQLAGQKGHCFGKGLYFARYASYADRYSRSSTDPLPLYGVVKGSTLACTKIIFLARVVIGKSTVGRRHFQKPDHGSLKIFYSSCVDNILYPNIFVVFDPNQIYPEYLVQYS